MLSTSQNRKVAKYKPGFDIRALEMSYRAQSEENNETVSPLKLDSELIWTKEDRLDFYCIECSEIIGASQGQETRFVLVQRHQTGAVHGYPITAEELSRLKRKHRQYAEEG